MKVSREQVAENRQKILDAASRLFRAQGFDAVTVVDVMKAAGLTHGGFYGYFKSKDDLIAQTLTYVTAQGARADTDLKRYAASYLSPDHRDDVAGGCPIAALGAETVRQTPEARAAMAEGLRRLIERFAASAPQPDAAMVRRNAIGSYAAMVGAVILARLAQDPALSDEVLDQTHAWILESTTRSAV
ncbi:TetR/AcrR family transcriptional regulator [Paraburkholderia nodosa]|uniref:TetR/AcrR family transcriptional regulator n=1 Tax=Paraburkholderia nodosa TaxID=392320 RepID=UPI0004851CA6|nr:TetR family transcriptional regulator [Paraburkholderia nodosa]